MVEAALQARRRQEQIIDAVMEHAPVGIAVALTGEKQLAYVSRFGTDMIGATQQYGHTWSAWQICHHDTGLPAAHENLPLVRACGGAVVSNEEWSLRAVDGTLVPISCNAGPIYDDNGTVVGGTAVWYDVTPFKEAQRQRELLLASVSHELRTPLNAIYSWSQVLRRSGDPELLQRGLESIGRNVQSQARLVEDLLQAARIAADKMSLELVPESLVSIARSAVDTVLPIAEMAQVALRLHINDEHLPVSADELRLRQAICNLLTNAIKFSPQGGLVEFRLARDGNSAQLEVADCGIGIEADQLGRVFDQFWQGGSKAVQNEGLGLGLSIARHIVLGHGGTLDAHSDGKGLGATFTLRLPLIQTN
jgi:PAS domain S-box-containing protein